MDHDLLMIIYGALIGLGSSVITTLFQSWLNRREHERQRRLEKKREQQQIRTPTMEELVAIRNGTYTIAKEVRIDPTVNSPYLHNDKRGLVIAFTVVLFYFCGMIYLLFWRNNPVLNLVITGLIVFLTVYIPIRIIKNR